MAELQTINESGDLTEIKLGGTTDGDKLLTSDEIEAKIPAAGVPYTGATTNVDLGDNTLDTKRLLQSNNGGSIFIGEDAGLNDDLTDNYNVFIGKESGKTNISGYLNTNIGNNALRYNTTGYLNTNIGSESLANNDSGNSNTALGANAGALTGSDEPNETGSSNTFLGYYTKVSADGTTNETVIGANANGNGSNTVTLGDDNVTDVYLAEDGTATANIGKIQLAALNTAPSSAAATGTLGEVRWDASYMYVCTATNTWKRSAIATW